MSLEGIIEANNEFCENPHFNDFWNDVQGAANELWRFIFLPEHRKKKLSGKPRLVVSIPHNADADGFASEIIHRGLEAILRLVGNPTRFAYERVVRLRNDPKSEESYQAIAAKHGSERHTLYWLADMGGTHYDEARRHFKRGIVTDHHQNNGVLGPGFRNVNPVNQGFGGDECSGATATYFVFDQLVTRLLKNNPFKLNKSVRSRIEEIRNTILISALAGANADQIGNIGLNKLLYTEARHRRLIKPVKTKLYGYETKKLYKVIAESSIPFNLKYPPLRKKEFFAALEKTLQRYDKGTLTSERRTAAEELYNEHHDLFMLQYNEAGSEGFSGVDTDYLRVNVMNAQMLLASDECDESIANVNELCERIGLEGTVLEKKIVSDEHGKIDVVNVNTKSGIAMAAFNGFEDDVKLTERRYKIVQNTLERQLKAYAKEKAQENGGQQVSIPTSTRKDRERSVCNATLHSMHDDQRRLFLAWYAENVKERADPFLREEYLADLYGDSYQVPVGNNHEFFQLRTLQEIGNQMTAMSKTRNRDPYLRALALGAKPEKNDVIVAHCTHSLYKYIIYAGMRRLEPQVLEKDVSDDRIGNRLYLFNFSQLEGVVNNAIEHVVDRFGGKLQREDVTIDLKTMVGVYLGILQNTGKIKQDKVAGFAFVDVKGGGDGEAKIKISGRINEYGKPIFEKVSLGELMNKHGGGGHDFAASAVIPKATLEAFKADVRHIIPNDNEYDALERRIAYNLTRRK